MVNIEKIKELRSKGFSGSKIAKELHLRKQVTLQIIREIEHRKKPKSSKIIYTPIKYLKPKQLIKKEKIISTIHERKEVKKGLTKKIRDFINKSVRKDEPDYKISKQFKGKEKKVLKEIKKVKSKIKKEKLKEVNKKSKCNYNYITPHHIGYKFERKVRYPIFVGITDSETEDIIRDIKNILERLYGKVICHKRMTYCSLEYTITLQDGSKEHSKISSNINGSFGIAQFKDMINQLPDLVYRLVDIVHQSQSSKFIEIYNIAYVNYDFKYNVS